MSSYNNPYPYQPLPPVYKPEMPEIKRKDIITCLAIFTTVFVFSLYASPVSIDFLFGATFTGYVKFLCLFIVFVISLFYVKRQLGASKSSMTFFALCSICFLLSYILNGGEFYTTPAFLYLVGAMCVTKTGSLTQKRNGYRYLFEELKDIFGYPLKYCLLPLKAVFGKIRFKKNKKLGGALLGFVFAIPVVAVLFGLLSSGDAAFSNVTSKLTDFVIEALDKLLLDNFDFLLLMGESVFMTLIFGPAVFSALFCFRYDIQKKVKENTSKSESTSTGFIPENVASGFFVTVCVLYVFYLFSQLSYFFGAFSGKIPLAVNMSLSEYARRGFFEMSAIAFINLGLIALGMIFVKRRENEKIAPLFKGVFTFLCLFTELLIITAMSKMALYITELGLTHKRILVCIIDVLLFATVLCVLVKLYKVSFPYMKIIVSLCCAVMSLYALVGDGALIAIFNTNAYLKGYHKELDVQTVCYEGNPYFTAKSLHKVAQAVPEMDIAAKYRIGESLVIYSDYSLDGKLEMTTLKSFFTSNSLSDFLFWEYMRNNPEFAKACQKVYWDYEYDYEIDIYYPDVDYDDYEYEDEHEADKLSEHDYENYTY